MNLRVGCDSSTTRKRTLTPSCSSSRIPRSRTRSSRSTGTPEPPPVRFRDLYGNVCRRVDLTPDSSSFSYHATVRISPEPEAMPDDRDVQHRVEELPPELLHWLLPSRLCESDTLRGRAWELFGETPRGAARVAGGLRLDPRATSSTACRASRRRRSPRCCERRGGMCRDFAHLGVTFCRALGIPARYVFGYLPDIGIPGPVSDDGLPRLVRGLAGRELVDVRRALQHAAHRPRADRARARRRRRRDGDDLRRGYARADEGLGRRESSRLATRSAAWSLTTARRSDRDPREHRRRRDRLAEHPPGDGPDPPDVPLRLPRARSRISASG